MAAVLLRTYGGAPVDNSTGREGGATRLRCGLAGARALLDVVHNHALHPIPVRQPGSGCASGAIFLRALTSWLTVLSMICLC